MHAGIMLAVTSGVDALSREDLKAINDNLVNYSKSLYDYTLRLWTESRREAEKRAQRRQRSEEPESRGTPLFRDEETTEKRSPLSRRESAERRAN